MLKQVLEFKKKEVNYKFYIILEKKRQINTKKQREILIYY